MQEMSIDDTDLVEAYFRNPKKLKDNFNCSWTKFIAIIVNVLVFNCFWKKFIAIIINVLVFFMQFFRLTILRFFLEHSMTSQVTFSRFRSSFLSNLCCSHSEVKLVANIKSVTALQK